MVGLFLYLFICFSCASQLAVGFLFFVLPAREKHSVESFKYEVVSLSVTPAWAQSCC